MTTLITGGVDYIRSHIVKLLSEKGYNTIIIDNLSSGYNEAVLYGKTYWWKCWR
ncbi:MAG: hypothetical protein QXS69_03425 [Candidatus Aenigmatarchaeota archaeon]